MNFKMSKMVDTQYNYILAFILTINFVETRIFFKIIHSFLNKAFIYHAC